MFDERKRIRRDLRVDFFRGLALITIFVDHVPHNRWAAITQQNFGFSDAAELFVALAGYSAVLAYGRYLDTLSIEGLRKLANRIGSIYVYHIGSVRLPATGLGPAEGGLAQDSSSARVLRRWPQFSRGVLSGRSSIGRGWCARDSHGT
jgi:hypothetical protein